MTSSKRSKKGTPSGDYPNLSDAKLLIYDTEATGVDWKRDRVVGHVVAWGPSEREVRYFPTGHEGGGNLDPERTRQWLRDIMSNPHVRVANHSLKFDLHMAANEKIDIAGPLECTQVNEALIDENQYRYNLDDVTKRYKDIPGKLGADLYPYLAEKFGGDADRKSQIGNFYRLSGDDPRAVAYACGDGTATWHLRERQHEVLKAENLERVWAVECRVLRSLFRMERRGVRVDEERLHRVNTYLATVLARAVEALPNGFNVRSGPQIKELYERAGFKNWPTTDKGSPSFTERWLSTNDIGRRIVAVRKITNLENSFIKPLLETHIYNGRVHCNFNQCKQDDYGTVTGRLSCNEPNMQQVPKRDKDLAPLFRQVFLPDLGHDWSANDYIQQEYVLFADYTNSARLKAGYNADPPVDIHQNVADILGVERDPTAKRMNFGMVNGMGVIKLAVSLSWELHRAKRVLDQYHAEFPEAREFLKAAEYYAKQRGWVRTKLGRRRRFPDARLAHKAGNNVIQGSAADITKLKMVEIDEYFHAMKLETGLMLQVHDELNWSLAPGDMVHDRHAIEIMESFGPNDVIPLDTRLRVSSHVAPDWGRASFPSVDWNKVAV